MPTIELTGLITEDGKLEVDLPEGLPAVDVKVTIELSTPLTIKIQYERLSLYGNFGATQTLRDLLENEESDQ